MPQFKSRFICWFKRKNHKSHFTALSLATIAGIIKFDPDVQLLLFKFLKHHSDLGPTIVLVCGIIFRYSNSDKHLQPPTNSPNSGSELTK